MFEIIADTVTVEVKDGALASIEVGENGETNGFIDTVITTYIPRVIENQSLAVDALTGATATCNGVRQGVEKALSVPSHMCLRASGPSPTLILSHTLRLFVSASTAARM